MPGFYHQPIRRRDFLKASCVAGAAVVFQGCQTLPGASSTENEIQLALLSDTHIGGDRERTKDPKGGFDPWENLHRIVPDSRASFTSTTTNGDPVAWTGEQPKRANSELALADLG